MGYISIADRRTLVSIWLQDRKRSQMIADDRRRSQTIAKDRTWFYLLRSRSQDRRRSQKCASIWSQTIAELSAICDPRSSAIIWKPAFNQTALRHILPECIAPRTTPGCHTVELFLMQHVFVNLDDYLWQLNLKLCRILKWREMVVSNWTKAKPYNSTIIWNIAQDNSVFSICIYSKSRKYETVGHEVFWK